MSAYVYFTSHRYGFLSRGWWIAFVGGSGLTHVCFGDDEVVVNPSFDGVRFWPAEVFRSHFPGIRHTFVVPTEQRPNLTEFENLVGVRQSTVKRFLRWITRGRYPMMDCTAQTSAMLKTCGIDVPKWVVTPSQLFWWMVGKGWRTEHAG